MPPRRLLVLALVALVATAPFGLVRHVLTDAPAPAGLAKPITEFGSTLVAQLDRPFTHARFVRAEMGPDRLTILYFEVRAYPFLVPGTLAYLISRCTPLDALDPMGMGGGVVQGDPATDAELAYLRSDAQEPCLEPSG